MDRDTPVIPSNIKAVIPCGSYCYDYRENKYYHCPFHEIIQREENGIPYEEGYCHYLKDTDLLLWDSIKMCGINEE